MTLLLEPGLGSFDRYFGSQVMMYINNKIIFRYTQF